MVSRPLSQRLMPSSVDRARPCRLRAYIAAMCGAPSASVPISVGAALTIVTSRSTVPSFVVLCWQLRLSDPAGEVGAGIVLSTAQPPVGASAGEVGAGMDRGGGERQRKTAGTAELERRATLKGFSNVGCL